MLRTKCIFDPVSEEDGLRISVMSRLTKNDGRTPDPNIQPCDFHIPCFGPSSKLIRKYYKEEWYKDSALQTKFEEMYLQELESEEVVRRLKIFAKLALKYTVTFLCVEKCGGFCHRVILANKCKEFEPGLVVEHR